MNHRRWLVNASTGWLRQGLLGAALLSLGLGAALAEAGRVTRSGGRVAICKWGRVEDREVQAVSEPPGRAQVIAPT
jgi:hypothetical protein